MRKGVRTGTLAAMRPNRSSDRLRTSLAAGAVAAVLAGSTLIASGPAAAAAPKKGAACTKAQLGKVSTTLVCTKVGSKYRWQTAAAAAVGATTPAAVATGVSWIGADILSTAVDGVLSVLPNPGNPSINADGRCSIRALVTYFTGCQGTVTLTGLPTAYNWRVVGQGGSEYDLYSKKAATSTTVGTTTWWVQSEPNELLVIWLPVQPSPIRAFYLTLTTSDRSPFTADPALIDRLVRTAGVLDSAVANRAK